MNERRRWWRDENGVREEIARYDDDGRLVAIVNASGEPEPGVEDPFAWPKREGVEIISADAYYDALHRARRERDEARRSAHEDAVAALVADGLPEAAVRRLLPAPDREVD